ncbi:hypothetical protein F4779DRAFT_591243 [Xylariaceae sp. FL0662B]|nr:hypothetical protein F4779DRAFT_591243 [Xylariaceae sp. FL0662B]
MCNRYPIQHSCGHIVYKDVPCAERPNQFGVCSKGIIMKTTGSDAWPCSACG